jgi:hypothetical protein
MQAEAKKGACFWSSHELPFFPAPETKSENKKSHLKYARGKCMQST